MEREFLSTHRLITDNQIKDLAVTPARGVRIERNHVYLSLVFHGSKDKLLRLNRKHLTLLHHYGKDGMSLAEAAQLSGCTLEQAIRFLKRRDVQEWIENLAQEAAVQRDWSRSEKWVSEGDKIYQGQKQVSKQQLEVWKEFGERFFPKPSRNAEQGPTKIEITVSAEALERSKQRRAAIDTQIVQNESHG